MAEDDATSSAHHSVHTEDATASNTSGESACLDASIHGLRTSAEPIFATLGDAEDASSALLVDLLDDMFDDMRVKQENARIIGAAVASAWRQALDGCTLAAAAAVPSLDAESRDGLRKGRRSQMLRPRRDDTAPTARRRRRRNGSQASMVRSCLSDLWAVVEQRPLWVEAQLAQFSTSRFRASALPACGRQGEWEIAVCDFRAFLWQLIRAARLGALGSTVEYVVHANAALLAKKARANAALQLAQLALCIQTAVLQAEEALHDQEHDDALSSSSSSSWLSNASSGAGVFQTEVAGETDGDPLVVYDGGLDPSPPSMDPNATGSVTSKLELSLAVAKRQRQARSVVSLLQRRASEDHKWGAVRKRLVVRDQHHAGIAVETDMAMAATTQVQVQVQVQMAPKKKASVAASPCASMPQLSPSKRFSAEPDASSTLSHLFSLGTPRQLAPDELTRRNDILSLLAREDASASRKMAVASIIAVSVPPSCLGADGKPIVSDHDKAFQAYIASHSSVTTTGGTCVVPVPSFTAGSPSVEKVTSHHSPLKPPVETRRGHGSSDDRNGKSKFELALEPPQSEIAEGNANARLALGRTAKSRGGGQRHTPSSSPTRAALLIPTSPSSPHRGLVETALGQLPKLLDTSRLAVGVNAVVRGVEKRGPRHEPSRKSRLRLHNYTTTAEGDGDPTPAATSPEKREPLPPVASPLKASPLRKRSVVFPPSPQRPPRPPPLQPHEPSSPVPPSGVRRFPAKQPTFETRASPPRVRNRHLTERAAHPSSKKQQFAKARWNAQNQAEDFTAVLAPRRDLTCSDGVDDE